MAKDLSRFILLTTQRTGSTWIVEVLSRQPSVSAIEEVFLNREDTPETQIGSKRERWLHYFKGKAKWLRPLHLWRYLSQVIYIKNAAKPITGFKLMYNQLLTKPELWAYFVLKRVRVVHLVRRNSLDVALSDLVRKHDNRSFAYDSVPLEPLEVDVDDLLAEIRLLNQREARHRRMLRLFRLPHIEVAYEDLKEDTQHFEPMMAFLGTTFNRNAEVSRFKKINRLPHHELIKNYAEVESALREHGFGHYLESES